MPDVWTALQFDSAVMVFGRHIENRANERDKDGEPVTTLAALLDIPDTRSDREKNENGIMFLKTLATMPGAVRILRTD